LDYSVYDASLPRRPVPTDIVIVAIDDASIESIGRWPWRRAVHAALLERL
ncbi:CHASE2 domain-containing protein, partial [Vibrio parahaemolyticus]